MKWWKIFFVVLPMLVSNPFDAECRLVFDWAEFEDYVETECDMFVDFENVNTGPTTKLKNADGDYLGVSMNTTEERWPLPVKAAPADAPVVVLPYSYVSTPENHRIMGTVNNLPDGQSKFVIKFDVPQQRVGLLRMWGLPVTVFLDIDGNEIADITSSSGDDFVGWIADEEGDKLVGSVIIDGLAQDPEDNDPKDNNKLYLVGSVDELYYTRRDEDLKSFEIEINNVESVVERGAIIEPEIIVRNIANYDQEGVRVEFKFYSYEQEKNIRILLTQNFLANEEITYNKYKLPVINIGHEAQVQFIEATVYASNYSSSNKIICAHDEVFYTINSDTVGIPYIPWVLNFMFPYDNDKFRFIYWFTLVILLNSLGISIPIS